MIYLELTPIWQRFGGDCLRCRLVCPVERNASIALSMRRDFRIGDSVLFEDGGVDVRKSITWRCRGIPMRDSHELFYASGCRLSLGNAPKFCEVYGHSRGACRAFESDPAKLSRHFIVSSITSSLAAIFCSPFERAGLAFADAWGISRHMWGSWGRYRMKIADAIAFPHSLSLLQRVTQYWASEIRRRIQGDGTFLPLRRAGIFDAFRDIVRFDAQKTGTAFGWVSSTSSTIHCRK